MENQIKHTDQLRCERSKLTMNELCFDSDVFYDCQCFWGCRMETHAIYCHNSKWDGKPMKCRVEIQSDCEGFRVNEALNPRKAVNEMEYKVIAKAISILGLMCAADNAKIVDLLTGYLFNEEESGKIKQALKGGEKCQKA